MDNRKLIIDKAITLFSRKSYEGVGVNQIVIESGITKPTLYYYFKSKRGLMITILDERITPILKVIENEIKYTNNIMGDLRNIAEKYSDFATKSENLYRLYKAMCSMPEESDSYKMVLPYKRTEYGIFAQLFKVIADKNGNIRGRYRVYARTFIGMLEVYNDMILTNFEYNDEELLYRMLHQFLHGIFS